MQRESALGQLQRRLDDLREAQRTKALQRGHERIRSGTRPGGQHPGKRNKRDFVPLKPLDGGGSRGDSISVNGGDFFLSSAVNERRNFPTKSVHMGIQDSFG